MAGYIPNAWRAALLEATAGRTAIGTTTVYLGLATAVPENPVTSTLANITEVNTAGYARVAVPTWSPATTTPSAKITTPTLFSVAPFTVDQVTPIAFAFLTSAQTGTAAPIRYLFPLAVPLRPAANRPIEIPANTLIIE